MSRKPIDALIINSQGFTFYASKVNCNNYPLTYKDDINNVSKPEMAMILSGLSMSGASMSYSQDCDIEGLEDGIIIVAEIAQLNLQTVQLVHLSACETGLGEIMLEGVFGLQRGFKCAGVKCIINTLAHAYTYVITSFDTTFIGICSTTRTVKGVRNNPFTMHFILLSEKCEKYIRIQDIGE